MADHGAGQNDSVVSDENFDPGSEVRMDSCTEEEFEISHEHGNIIACEEDSHEDDDNGTNSQSFDLIADEESFQVDVDDGSFTHGDGEDEAMEIGIDDGSKGKGEYFILPTLDEVKNLISNYCERTSSHFVVHKKTKDFGSSEHKADISAHRIQWHDIRLGYQENQENIIEFDGTPHVILGHYTLNCQFGIDTSASQKMKRKKMKEDGEINVRTRIQKIPTKKCGCPAKITIKQVIRFPQFKIQKDTVRRKTTNSTKLKEQLKSERSEVAMEVSFIGRLADVSEHKYHELIQGEGFSKEEVHHDLVIKAQELYLQNNSVEQIIYTLNTYVIDEMFWKREPPDPCRRRYHPRRKDVLNFIARIQRKSRFTPEEQAKIWGIVDRIKTDYQKYKVFFYVKEEDLSETTQEDEIRTDSPYDEFFEPDTAALSEKQTKEERRVQTFLFCYQTPLQQRLMKMYGNITYITEIESDVPLNNTLTYRCFVIFVQTNVDYQVIGFISHSKQRKNGLVDGLKMFQEWNSFWNPKYVFVDYAETMFDAVSVIFPDAGQFLNLHSCENKWMEFTNTPSNDVQEHATEIIGFLRGMQYSLTEEALSSAASLFEGSEIWQSNEKLRRWFQGKWLHLAKCWVFGYRPEDLVVMHHLNITAVDGLAAYRDAFCKSVKGEGFVELLSNVTGDMCQAEYVKYVTRNNSQFIYYDDFSRNCIISNGLQGVPKSILPYVERIDHISQRNKFNISEDQIGTFNVTCEVSDQSADGKTRCKNEDDFSEIIGDNHDNKGDKICSETGDNGDIVASLQTDFSLIRYLNKIEMGSFTVSFGDITSYPFCTCSYWNTYKLPCVHMMAVFRNVPGWSFHMLSPLYRFNPVINIDYSVIFDANRIKMKDGHCQTTYQGNSVSTQINGIPSGIFENPTKIPITETLLQQAKGFLEHIRLTAVLFKDKVFHRKLHEELQCIILDIQKELINKVKLLKSLNFFTLNVQGNKTVKESANESSNYPKSTQEQEPRNIEINQSVPLKTKDSSQTRSCNIPQVQSGLKDITTTNALNTPKTSSIKTTSHIKSSNLKSTVPIRNFLQSGIVQSKDLQVSPYATSVLSVDNKYILQTNDIPSPTNVLQTNSKNSPSSNDNLQITVKRPNYSIMNTLKACNDDIKKRKLSSTSSTVSTAQKNENSGAPYIMKDSENVFKIKYHSKPVLPSGTITLEDLTGKYKKTIQMDKEVNEKPLKHVDGYDDDNVDFVKGGIELECFEGREDVKEVLSEQFVSPLNVTCENVKSNREAKVYGSDSSPEKGLNYFCSKEGKTVTQTKTYPKRSRQRLRKEDEIVLENIGIVKKGCG